MSSDPQTVQAAIDDGDVRTHANGTFAALYHHSPPMMATFAGATPGTPPSRMPRPRWGVPDTGADLHGESAVLRSSV